MFYVQDRHSFQEYQITAFHYWSLSSHIGLLLPFTRFSSILGFSNNTEFIPVKKKRRKTQSADQSVSVAYF